MTIVFVMGDVKAVGGTVNACFVFVHVTIVNRGRGICFPQGGLNLSQDKKQRAVNMQGWVATSIKLV